MTNTSHLKELTDQKYALDQAAIVANTNAQGQMIYVNDKFCEISGYSREELIGNTHRILNSSIHDPAFFVNLWRTLLQGKVWRGDICNRKKTGESYWVQTTIVPLLDDNLNPFQFLSISNDITALKEAQDTIVAQQAKISTTSKFSALGEISASITHEINNPLSVILGRNEMLRTAILKGEKETDKLLRLIAAIENNVGRIEKIIKSMRTFSHDASTDPFEKTKILEVMNEALEITEQRIKNHSIRLELKVEDPDLTIECRPTQIMQIIINLINNAHDILFSQPSNSEKLIKVAIRSIDKWAEIEVIDNGPGVLPELQSKIFEPFFSTKEAQYGTGLGLSISRSLARQHNGDLYLDPLCFNTCFLLKLPLVHH